MGELTVGYVAGFIAVGIFVAQVLIPTGLNFILAGALRENETAATWSVAGRSLQSSYFPDIFQSDTARFYGVRRMVRFLVGGKTWLVYLIALSGIITPLGLYEALDFSDAVMPSFTYAPDTSFFGLTTPPRSDLPFNRICYWLDHLVRAPGPCPYSTTDLAVSWDGTSYSLLYPNGYNTTMPSLITEIFSSGTLVNPTTVSNFFDIQWRQYSATAGSWYNLTFNNGSRYLVGKYRPIQNLFLDGSFHLVEGLVVDILNGGLGFRNHTIPSDLPHGGSWEEDLLFIEPETSCVDTNLTLEYTAVDYDPGTTNPIVNLTLVDKGGFVFLNQTYPGYDHEKSQSNPDLQARAYKAAYLHNAWSMAYLNVTSIHPPFRYVDSTFGKQYPLPGGSSTSMYLTAGISSYAPTWLLSNTPAAIFSGFNVSYSNPYNVTSSNFDSIGVVCAGASDLDIANISDIYVACGLVRGAPVPLDGTPSSLRFQDGSRWSSSLYSCASTLKARIKTVSFLTNGTSSTLSDLAVKNIRPKSYSSPSEAPIWGVEDSGLAVIQIRPVWGLVSSAYSSFPNVSIVQKPELYLPVGWQGSGVGSVEFNSQDNTPAATFGWESINTLYYGLSSEIRALPDYYGGTSVAVLSYWQKQSTDPKGIAAMMNTLWTDLAAPAVVGTKSVNSAMQVKVSPVVRRVKYNILYAIPAFLVAVSMALILAASVVLMLMGKVSGKAVVVNLKKTSVGRIFMTFLSPEASDLSMGSTEWSLKNGKQVVMVV
ncbi:hypothetical protein GQ53DRAFT_865652 [Thozetella sp. PMI_491]|nr:hypothetical protein GQ53DRAFT_865652 [Thozetella sp. PMI_491]